VDAVFTVRLGAQYELEWIGARRFPRSAIEADLRISEERRLDVATMTALATRVRDFYVRRGFLDARARVEVRTPAPGQAVLRFTVTEGPRVLVQNVRFPGATHVSSEVLGEILSDVLIAELPGGSLLQQPERQEEASLDGSSPEGRSRFRLQPARTYVPEVYAEAARRMVLRYREQGFLDATVPAPEVARVRDAAGRPGLEVTFHVSEGARTVFDEVRFEGNRAVSSRELAERSGLRLGGPLSYAALDTARTQLVEFYREEGYLFARVDSEIDRSPDRSIARVRFVVHEGPQVQVGRIIFRGSPHTRAWVIEERLALRTGGLYRPSEVRTTQRQLGELGIFSGVTITPVEPDVEAPVKDVLIQLTELRPFAELRAGVSSGEGLRLGGDFAWRNVGGTGVTFATGLQVSHQLPFFIDPLFQHAFEQLSLLARTRVRAPLSLQFPAIRGLGPAWRASVDIAAGRIIERQFAINSAVAGASATWRPARQFSLTLTPAEVQTNQLELLGANNIEDILQSASPGDRERLRRLLLLPDGITTLFATRFTAALDLRDQVFNPQRGLYLSLTGEYVNTLAYEPREHGGGGSSSSAPEPGNTLRGTLSATVYVPVVPLPFGNIVVASTLRGGVNYNLERCKVTYTNRQFFLGGAETLRGWLQDSLIPQDVFDNQGGPPADCTDGPTMGGNTDGSALAYSQRGGDVFLLMRNEVRVPIFSTGLVLGLFWDFGNLWKDLRNVPHYVDPRTGQVVNGIALRHAAGVGLRYVTPIGPVGLDLGFNLSPRLIAAERPNPDMTPDAQRLMPVLPAVFELPYAINFSIGNF
jgi:outer membrane protein assembly factor BamA